MSAKATKRNARIVLTVRQNRQTVPTNQQVQQTQPQAPPTIQQAPPPYQPQELQQQQPQQEYQLRIQHLQQQQYQLQLQQQQLQQQQRQLQLQADGQTPHLPPYQAQESPRQAAASLSQVVHNSPARRYRAKTAKTLGSLQITLAIVSLVLGIVAAALGSWAARIGIPIWGGILFYLPSGILGVLSTKPTNMQNCVITSCMVMSILSSLVAGTSMIISCISAATEYYYWNPSDVVMDAILAILAVIEVIVSIMQSSYCCKHRCACCHKSQQNEGVHFTTPVPYASPHNQSLRGVYPQRQQQQQQHGQFIVQQRPMPAYGVQGTVPLQRTPGPAVQPAHPNNIVSDFLMTQDERNAHAEPQPPAYSDSPPPSYSLSTGYM